MRKFILVLSIILFMVAGMIAVNQANKSNLEVHYKKIQLQDNAQKLKDLQQKYDKVDTQKAQSDQQVKQLNDEKAKLEQEKKDLEAQLQAKAEIKQQRGAVAYAASLPKVETPTVVAGCGENQYSQYIYQHESGCNLNAVNSGGCRGIGQACPGSKLPCGADYACQNAFFESYAIAKYGSWVAAYNFWVNNHWW